MEAMSRFHGPVEELVSLLSEGVVWHVPGQLYLKVAGRGLEDAACAHPAREALRRVTRPREVEWND